MMRAPSATSKEERTEGIPVFPGGVRWRDGSILADIPLSQMRRQFGVNQYIVSQTNPHVRFDLSILMTLLWLFRSFEDFFVQFFSIVLFYF